MCDTALDRHSRGQRPLYTGTNTRYASMHTNSVSQQNGWNYFTKTRGVWSWTQV